MHRADHWSMVIVANLTSLVQRLQKDTAWTDLPEKLQPCIVYLDPLWKADKSIGVMVQLFLESAILHSLGRQEYVEKRFKLCDGDFLLNEITMKDFQALVPRQRNTYDCGLFVLEYIEKFCSEDRAKDFMESLYRQGHKVRWFPYSLISNKRVLLTNILMNYVNGMEIEDCIDEYLSKKAFIMSVVGENQNEYDVYFDTEGIDTAKIEAYYDTLPLSLAGYYSTTHKPAGNKHQLGWTSPALTEVD